MPPGWKSWPEGIIPPHHKALPFLLLPALITAAWAQSGPSPAAAQILRYVCDWVEIDRMKMELTDMELVREYAASESDRAFAELVSRHVDLVYSAALRQVRDPHLAQEVTQAVFLILARKARSLGAGTILPAWLCRTARHASGNAMRSQWRRRQREQEAYMQSRDSQPGADGDWAQIAPLLDAGMGKLPQKDHDALVLRYFENRSFGDVGAALGVSDDAAKMRVSRAVEKMRKFFGRHGVALSAGGIASAMSAGSVQAAPAAVTASVVAVTTARVASVAGGSALVLATQTLKLMFWNKMKIAAVAATAVTATVIAVAATVHAFDAANATPQSVGAGAKDLPGKAAAKNKGTVPKDPAGSIRQLTVRVVDEEGRPIPSATIEFPMDAIEVGETVDEGEMERTMLLGAEGVPQVINADRAGKIMIPLPAKAIDDAKVKFIRLLVRAPGFCFFQDPVSLVDPDPIVLKKGSHVVIRAEDGAGRSVRPYVNLAKLDGPGGHEMPFFTRFASWQRVDGEAIETHLPEGEYTISVVDFSPPSPRYSPPRYLKIDGSAGHDLEFKIAAGMPVRGSLDNSVPRPVNNGLVIACVITPSENNPSSHGEWQASCPISEDGTFVFEDLPVGELRVIALCEGAISTPTTGFNVVLGPQNFGSRPPTPIEVKMSAAGTLRMKVTEAAGGAPAPAAEVSWNITQNLDNFNGWGLGMTTADSAPVIRVIQDTPSVRLPSIDIRNRRATANAEGEVVISNLPPMPLHFYVYAKDCERAVENVRIEPGDANTLAVRLKPKGAAVSGASPASSPRPPQEPVSGDHIPFGSPVEGKPGFVTSPHSPYSGSIDVRGFPSGTEVKDPYSGKIFLVP